MEAKTITINVVDKRPIVEGSPIIVCDNSNYVIAVTFDGEWAEHPEKTARFAFFAGGGKMYKDVPFSGSMVTVPILSGIRSVDIGFYAGDLSTTTPARVPCDLSIRSGNAVEHITPGEKAALEAQIGDLAKLQTENKSDLVSAINEVARHGGGTGGSNADLTGYATEKWVQEGFQPKGDYLTEHQDISGKLDADKLPEAVNDALTQAKASGEFDGKDGQDGKDGKDGQDGQDGYTPVKGVDYWTEADQEAIVQQVIAALGSPVFGRVDEENNIILSGELADGTYVVKYEDGEGNATVIGAIQQGIAEAVRYGYVYGTCNRVGGDDYRMFHDDLGGETNYYMIYQDSGEAPLHADETITTASKYYPLEVPAGKTKIKFTFPNLQKPLLMAVPTLSLSDGVYTRISNSGWLTEGVYEYEFGAGVEYIAANFRNNGYTGLNVSGNYYDISGFTLEWL